MRNALQSRRDAMFIENDVLNLLELRRSGMFI